MSLLLINSVSFFNKENLNWCVYVRVSTCMCVMSFTSINYNVFLVWIHFNALSLCGEICTLRFFYQTHTCQSSQFFFYPYSSDPLYLFILFISYICINLARFHSIYPILFLSIEFYSYLSMSVHSHSNWIRI